MIPTFFTPEQMDAIKAHDKANWESIRANLLARHMESDRTTIDPVEHGRIARWLSYCSYEDYYAQQRVGTFA